MPFSEEPRFVMIGVNCRPTMPPPNSLHRVADADLVHRAHDGHRVVRVGHDEHHVRLGRADAADQRGEVGGGRRVVLVVHRLQAGLLRQLARAVGQVLRELVVGGEERDGLRALLLADGEEAVGPARGVVPRRVVEPHVVLDGVVHLEREIAHQQQVALLDQRHDRRGGHRPIGRDQQVDLVDVEQLGVDRRGERRVGLVVVDDEIDLAPEQAALGVDVLDPHAAARAAPPGRRRRAGRSAACSCRS